MVGFLVQIAIAVAMMIISQMLAPRPKQPKPESAQDLESPSAEAGKPIPVVFGTMTVKGLNVLWFGQKESKTYNVKA